MEDFFKNDFTEDYWKKAALKNAFVLMGRQRYHHAAAFFLLGGSLKDAIQVSLKKALSYSILDTYCSTQRFTTSNRHFKAV